MILKKYDIGETRQPNHHNEYDFLYSLNNPSKEYDIGFTAINYISSNKYDHILFAKNITKCSNDSFYLHAFNLLFCKLHKK